MPKFSYTAKLPDGRTINGVLEASSELLVKETLHRQGLVIVAVKGTKTGAFQTRRVRLDDMAIFCRQMATLVDAGIPIVVGLESVGQQLENKTLKGVVLKVAEDVEGGMNFTAAIARHSKVFSTLFISMVKAGEASGHLADVLDRLAIYLEKTATLQRKIRSALVYPAIVVTMALLITSFLILKVIPAFKEIFATLGAKLPLPTQILILVSDLAQQYFLIMLGILVLVVMVFRYFIKTPKGRLWFDQILLKLMILGPLVRKVAISRFARTLSTLVKSGVQILAALEIVSETAGNQVVANVVLRVRSSIREGEDIAGPLALGGVFPPMVVRMVAVGEQTGRLDEMLTKVADFYEDQVDAAVAGLTAAIEPVVIAFLGIVVGSIVLAIFLPIFKVTELVGKM